VSDKFHDIFSDEMLCAATAVDPRFKLCVFNSDTQQERAHEATLQLMQKRRAALTATTELATDEMPDNEADTQSSSVAASIWSKLQRAEAEASIRQGTMVRQAVEKELERYLDEPLLDRQACPYAWWARHRQEFPTLAGVARRLFCCPATSVASKRVFSKAGDVITKKRNVLAPSKAQKVVFVMENM